MTAEQTKPVPPQAPLARTAVSDDHPDTWPAGKQIAHMEQCADRKRQTGTRIEIASTGSYDLYGADGRSLGRTYCPTPFWGYTEEELKAVALRMAFSEELLAALTAILMEVDGSARPYSADSYLPAHLLDAARAAATKAGGA